MADDQQSHFHLLFDSALPFLILARPLLFKYTLDAVFLLDLNGNQMKMTQYNLR